MSWSIDLQDNDGSLIAAAVPFRIASPTWELDGPGSLEVDLAEGTEDEWAGGKVRAVVREDDAARWAGWMTRLTQQGRPAAEKFKASGLGLAKVLDRRVVHGDFSQHMESSTDIAWALINHAQEQENGDHGFTLGTVVGTAPSRSRDFCDGDVIGERINDLAAFKPGGFDWEIDAASAFNAWVGGRGEETELTLAPSDVHEWSVENETVDLATYATGLGDDEGACGPALAVASDAEAIADYGRREIPISIDSEDAEELEDAAAEEVESRIAAAVRLTVSWLDGRGPWSFGDVWLGDTLEAELRTCFGGTQMMRIISVSASLEPDRIEPFVTYELERAR